MEKTNMNQYLKLFGFMILIPFLSGCLASLPTAFSSSPSSSSSPDSSKSNTYLASDDYKGGDEIVDVFLTDAEYAKMVKDFTYHGADFD